jgi:hypothetical protein
MLKQGITMHTTKFSAIAEQANKIAREFILVGSTQLINNDYSRETRNALAKAIRDMRVAVKRGPPAIALELEDSVGHFYRQVGLSKKLSLGNCGELALIALDHILSAYPDVNAEAYQIAGGDHMFLVIGRLEGSDPSDPATWGPDAYICDPWSNKSYPAKDYLTELKNYYFKVKPDGTRCNHTEPFDPLRHKLIPVPGRSTMVIRQANSNQYLGAVVKLFQAKQQVILSALDKFHNDLSKIEQKLLQKYGEGDEKLTVVRQKIANVQVAIATMKSRNETSSTCQNLC